MSHLTPEQVRAYRLADNKLALNATWDQKLLALEFQELDELKFDLSVIGFSDAEIDVTFQALDDQNEATSDAADEIPQVAEVAVCRPGDIWTLGRHRLICGDARDENVHRRLLQGELADLVFTDPPYNVPIDGHVSGMGRMRHREFAMASGEMSKADFTDFLTASLSAHAGSCRDGAIAFVCMDWRHLAELIVAGDVAFDELKNVCIWNKTNGGLGSFYRSKHELIFVFKKGAAPHTNNFGLGDKGRYRTNVWDYPGISSRSATRAEDLAMHPTVKPVALVAEAIKDCSKRGQIVLDGFGGSGTTLIAADRTGRKARLIEFDPLYCDVILRRYTRLTGQQPMLEETGQSFEELESNSNLRRVA